MSKKVRATLHSGKGAKGSKTGYLAGHNDRTLTANAEHIDKTKEGENTLWAYDGNTENFTEGELDFYRATFKEHFDNLNANALKARHAERVKSLEERYRIKMYCPTETILQIGKATGEHATPEQLTKASETFWKKVEKNFPQIKLLNYATHSDESVPHAHCRYVVMATDKKTGLLYPCVEKGLEQMGVPLPDPTHTLYWTKDKKGNDIEDKQKNCRLVTFTENLRLMWCATIEEETGIHIEYIPDVTVPRGLTKAQWVANAKREAEEELFRLQEEISAAQQLRADQEGQKKLFSKTETVTIPKSEYETLLKDKADAEELRPRVQTQASLDAREHKLGELMSKYNIILDRIQKTVAESVKSAYDRLVEPLKKTLENFKAHISNLRSIEQKTAPQIAVRQEQTALQKQIEENTLKFYKGFQEERDSFDMPELEEHEIERMIKDEIYDNIGISKEVKGQR